MKFDLGNPFFKKFSQRWIDSVAKEYAKKVPSLKDEIYDIVEHEYYLYSDPYYYYEVFKDAYKYAISAAMDYYDSVLRDDFYEHIKEIEEEEGRELDLELLAEHRFVYEVFESKMYDYLDNNLNDIKDWIEEAIRDRIEEKNLKGITI